METLDITKIFEDSQNIKKLIVENSGEICIEYPLSSINMSNSHLDVISDYLDALYISEEIGKYSTIVNTRKDYKKYCYPVCQFEIAVKDIDSFVQKVNELSVLFYDDQDDDFVIAERAEEINDFEQNLESQSFVCPELADDYYASLVHGAYFEMKFEYGDEYLENEYEKFPERRFGFWKSANSTIVGEDFYVSTDCWIVPSSININNLIQNYSGLTQEEIYQPAVLFGLEKYSYCQDPKP